MTHHVKIGSAMDRLPRHPGRLPGGVKPVDPFYRTREWVEFSSAIKRARGYRCEACGADHTETPWKLRSDHKVARKDGGADFDPLNILCLCAACDNRKRAREHQQRGAAQISGAFPA
ncbi:MAG: HNH endonuclease [Proteobacteria bacterium]|nr:HNH endonuclease [Pseudomonadota bacterium]